MLLEPVLADYRVVLTGCHPEYSTPEVTGARDLVLWDKAGEIVMAEAARRAALVPGSAPIQLYNPMPAGNRAASQAHVCRTVARRAERAVVALGGAEELRETPRQYLNRLSDLLFVLARVLNRANGGDDVYWKSERLARAS